MNKTRILDSSHISWSSFPPQFIENYVVTWSFITRFSVFFSHLVLSTFKRPQQHYLMFIHFCFMYLLYHLYLIFLHLKYLIQDCFTTRYLCGKFLKAVWLIFFFFYHYPLFGWQFGQTENSWFKFLILNILKTLLHCFISSSILIPFHVPYFFILEINSKFCHSLKFSIHVNFLKKPYALERYGPIKAFFLISFELWEIYSHFSSISFSLLLYPIFLNLLYSGS